MSMRVTEGRHHKSALSVDELCVSAGIGIKNNPFRFLRNAPSPCGQGGSTVFNADAGTVISAERSEWRNDSWTVFSDDAVFDHEVCIFHAFHMIHLRPFQSPDI